jgi:hypothetical protein
MEVELLLHCAILYSLVVSHNPGFQACSLLRQCDRFVVAISWAFKRLHLGRLDGLLTEQQA